MRILLYFVKWPEPGKVKTRLAKKVGDVRAAAIYRQLAETNFRSLVSLKDRGVSLVVAYDPPEAEAKIKSWLPKGDLFIPQSGGNLGERLRCAFDFFTLNPTLSPRRVIAAGSDTIGLQAGRMVEAYEALEEKNLVLGPAKDGGYYLIGLSHPEPRLFEGIPWSSSAVFETTLTRAEELRLSYHLLPPLEDLDDSNSQIRYRFWRGHVHLK